jgi:hypothetical protein
MKASKRGHSSLREKKSTKKPMHMMHPEKLGHGQQHTRIPRQAREGREDGAEDERGEGEDCEAGVLRREKKRKRARQRVGRD